MNQFKDVFTGQRQVDYKRATSSQKCIRAGGKHNDLDNVGFTARHHTFFEMLGNFSFGDYFKEEAIKFAWEWLTKELKLPASRLYATVYQEDNDAFGLWEKIAPELKDGRIMRFGKKDNYWSMGELGPCGPCSEIHFDRGVKYGSGPNDVVNGETDRFVEIWNLVFMQYDQLPGGKMVDLPKPSVDTGAGLERLAAIVQNVETNYHIDLFKNIIAAISEITKSDYKKNLASHHVIADHLRALTFAIADGAGISNEGQGYVLRRILRRAARHGRNLGMNEPFIYKLVPVLVEEMAQAYPEIKEKRPHIINVIHAEEEAFGRTLETGLAHINEYVLKAETGKFRIMPGEVVFRLYDTFGFPYDLTEIIAAEHGLTLDKDGFEKLMQKQQEQSRKPISSKDWSGEIGNQPNMYGMQTPPTEFVREDFKVETKLEFVQVFRHTTLSAEKTEDIVMILTKTPFYLESGGQISDTGKIYNDKILIEVNGIGKQRDWYLHYGRLVKGSYDDIKNGINVKAEVNSERRWDIMRNHTATHLAQAALRKVLGTHVRQSGSYVGPDRLRFDFSHHQPMTADEIRQVEEIVNGEIIKGSIVNTELMPLEKAKKTGAMALFGEKYGDKVRVVSIDDFSKELCGGTHVENVGQIGPFRITLETGVASGVRRLEAVTGTEALTLMLSDKNLMRQIGTLVGRQGEEIVEGVELLRESNVNLKKEVLKFKSRALMVKPSKECIIETSKGTLSITFNNLEKSDKETMSLWIDSQQASKDPVFAIALGTIGVTPTLMMTSSGSAISQFELEANKIANQVFPLLGGKGGGRPSFARGKISSDKSEDEIFNITKNSIEEYIG